MKVKLTKESIELLKQLIATPSFSSDEGGTATLIQEWLSSQKVVWKRDENNVWAVNASFDSKKPSILLNSHHDTVRPNNGYIKDPFVPEVLDGKLFGLGSNDAGGCLVSLMATFTYFYNRQNLNYNLIFVASAEEENSGLKGLNSMVSKLPKFDFAIIGEPTLMQLAIAEKGLMVLDCYASGESGHAAHTIGNNAIYNALDAIKWFENFEFKKESNTLGKVKMTVTQINAGKQHNVIPAECHFVVDIRVTDQYTNQEILDIIKKNVKVTVKPRSMRLNSSSINENHPIVKAGVRLGRSTYGSPTLSDQAVLTCPSLKLGPGDSLRSHTADEFIYLHEIEYGIKMYTELLEQLL